MRSAIVAALAALALGASACGAPRPVASSPSPSAEPTSGGVTVSGGFSAQFLYHQPPKCGPVDFVLLNLNNQEVGTLVLGLRYVTSPGIYTIDPRYNDSPAFSYTGRYGNWGGSSGTITVKQFGNSIYSGTIEALLTYDGSYSIPIKANTARATGTWACSRDIPIASSSPVPPASAARTSNPADRPGGVTLSGAFDAQFLFNSAPSCSFHDPTHISVGFDNMEEGQFSLDIRNAKGVGTYAIDPRYSDSPGIGYQGRHGV